MDILRVDRFAYSRDFTLGSVLLADGSRIYTIEDPWLNNQAGESCIPDGLYDCRPRFFHRGGYQAIEVAGVPGRDLILFHRGNTTEDVTGCLVVGTELGYLVKGGKRLLAALNSLLAWERFFPSLEGREFKLSIGPMPGVRGTA